MGRSKRYFDKQDWDMLALLNKVLTSPATHHHNQLLDANLHPHGIKDLVLSQEFRVAYAVINLLTSLEAGQVADRLQALQALYDEALTSAQTNLRRNTARVLIQIMKELVRTHGDELAQLKLAHDFRRTASGTPRVVRHMLSRYHLPEMPEDWSQLAFDDHVHDANTKGRKTPTHLIMDAWVKGVRKLTVVYYNFVDQQAAQEILQASAIMGISVRIGLEFRAPFRGRLISIIWVPRGFSDSSAFLEFLCDSKVCGLMDKGREASRFEREKVLHSLHMWNTHRRPEVEKAWHVPLPELSEESFLEFVSVGQPSRTHLAECLHKHVLPAMQQRAAVLQARALNGDVQAGQELQSLDSFGSEGIMEEWLCGEGQSPPGPFHCEGKAPPEILTMPVGVLVSWLTSLHSGFRIILNLADLSAEDVLEILWDCQGGITHLELFNLKDWHQGRLGHLKAISELQTVLNQGRGPRIKQLVRLMIRDMQHDASQRERLEKFQVILRNVPMLWEYYRNSPLKSRMGSDSTSRTVRNFGMGLVFPETLPLRAQRWLRQHSPLAQPLPIHTTVEERISYTASESPRWGSSLTALIRKIPGCRHFGRERTRQWWALSDTSRVMPEGNLATLGGSVLTHSNGLLPESLRAKKARQPDASYLNSTWANWIKVMAGFIPSAFSFWYTQDWWFLALFGTFIWFAITGVRNIIQMVVAARGVTRTTLLRWKDHVSVNRLCDSLMYTGISVLLLEMLVRVMFLEQYCGISVKEHPLTVYTVLNIVNGFYICAHNVYRGFPRAAAIGNIFRSALAIPVSSLYNLLFLQLLLLCDVANPLFYVVPSAAIISKLASDTVAAIIEGYADSQNNLRMRRWDYKSKLKQVYACYTRLELLFPEEDVLIKLAKPGGMGERMDGEAKHLERALLINALDLMYFWFYQPRAQKAFVTMVRHMPQADRTVLARSQLVLVREKEISQLFVDGLVGRNFSRPLAFYLARRQEYLRAMTRLCTPGRRSDALAGQVQPELMPAPVLRHSAREKGGETLCNPAPTHMPTGECVAEKQHPAR